MRDYSEIYTQLNKHRKNIEVFHNERHWLGDNNDMSEIGSLVYEITGIRPGGCSGCAADTLKNARNWLLNYEKNNQHAKLIPKKKR